MGQSQPVQIHYVNSGDAGVDHEIWGLVGRKLESLQLALDGGGSAPARYSSSTTAPAPPASRKRGRATKAGDDDDDDGDGNGGGHDDDPGDDGIPDISGLGAALAAAAPRPPAAGATVRAFFSQPRLGAAGEAEPRQQQASLLSHFPRSAPAHTPATT